MPRTQASRDGRATSLAAKSLSAVELQVRRRGLGLTQAELAKRLGVRSNTVARWERGELHPLYPEEVARRLARLESAKAHSRLAETHAGGIQPPDVPTAIRTNLPAQLSSFIGRERELAEVRRLLAATRLLCLSGPGGIGKTRLAIEAARWFAVDDPDGVWLVELASVAHRDLVVGAVASVLGVIERADQCLMNTVGDAIRGQSLLLLLDNCEHLLDACAEFADALLRKCPQLRILATSREPLGIGGETIWRVPPLAVAGSPEATAVDRVVQADAIRLFVERARAALPSFDVTEQNARVLVQLCQRLDGIPLALELAAARVPVLSVAQILERVDDALPLLTAGSRIAPQRQQTLRATLEWSYRLLSEPEQLLFRRLSVFAGGWTLEAVETICASDGILQHDVLPLLARLVDKSLVLSEERPDVARRYRLLETLRQFAAERLRETGDTVPLHDRHMGYFLAIAKQARVEYWSRQQARWFAWFDRELDNLRTALDWAIECGSASAGLRLGAALECFWWGAGRITEGRSRLEALLALPDASSDQVAKAWGLIAAAGLTRRFPEHRPLASSYADQALALTRGIVDAPDLLFEAVSHVGWSMLFMGELHMADDQFQEALNIAHGLGLAYVARAMCALGWTRVLEGDYTTGRSLLEDGVARLRALGEQLIVGMYLSYLTELDLREGRNDDARRHAGEALEHVHYAPTWGALLDAFIRWAAAAQAPERVLRLAAAVSIARPYAGNSSLTSPDLVERARRELGEAKSAALWAEGQLMTRDEIVALGMSREPEGAQRNKLENGPSARLTRREEQVLRMLAQGKSNREIGIALVLSVRTVERHIANAYTKIGVQGRVGATTYVLRQGLA